jgi:hypothetical protein
MGRQMIGQGLEEGEGYCHFAQVRKIPPGDHAFLWVMHVNPDSLVCGLLCPVLGKNHIKSIKELEGKGRIYQSPSFGRP